MQLNTSELTQESLAGIGRLLTNTRLGPKESTEGHCYWDVDLDLQLEAPLSSGMLECYPRELKLERMEHHHHTREMLVTLEGDVAICLAPPQEKESGMLDGIVSLRMQAGQAILLEVGAWHWIPFPLDGRTARIQVVFRSGTGRTDLIFHELPHPIAIQAPTSI